jgi:putative salt-induced outer membrane protein YdiY
MKSGIFRIIPVLLMLAYAVPAFSQAPAAAAPVKPISGSFGAGLAITGGNTDTKNFNLTFDFTRDPKTRNVFKANALYLRSDANNLTTSDRFMFSLRDEYALSKKAFVYGAWSYMRDPFKAISYLINPQGGFGYKLVEMDHHTFTVSGGAGGVWEKNPGFDVRSSGTVNFGQGYVYKLSDATTFTQGFTALWKTSDFEDAWYHFGVALATSITKRIQVKVEFIDDYKNVTPNPLIKNNDTAFLTSFLFKF